MKRFIWALMTMAMLLVMTTVASAAEPAKDDTQPSFGTSDKPIGFFLRGGMTLLLPQADGGLGLGVGFVGRLDDRLYVGLGLDGQMAFTDPDAPNLVIGGGDAPSAWNPSFGLTMRGCLGIWVHRVVALEIGLAGATFNLGSDRRHRADYVLTDVAASVWLRHVNLGIGWMFGSRIEPELGFATGMRLFFGYVF